MAHARSALAVPESMQKKDHVDKASAGAPQAALAFARGLGQAAGMILRLSPAADGATVRATATTIPAQTGQNLAQAVWLSGRVPPLPLCGGLGRCGRCRVRFVRDAPPPLPAETAYFSEGDLAAGWRLACRRQVPDDATELELPPEHLFPAPAAGVAAPSARPSAEAAASLPELALAVDLGTTSVYWRALDAAGAAVAQGHGLNPQAGAGADVMSRLAVARRPEGRRRLAGLARGFLRDVMAGLERRGLGRVTRLCLAANTAMTDIFCDRDVEGLCAAPYRLSHGGNEVVALPDFPPVYLPPLSAPFVGGDVSAGLTALLAAGTPRPFVLADLGTNGELALLTREDQLWLTSVPLGPALEGIGPECGRPAGPGVVTSFGLRPAGLTAAFHPAAVTASPASGAARARGISATGYLSLLAILLRTGLLTSEGHFVAAPPMPLARRLAANLEPGDPRHGARLHVPHGLWLAAADVEELLKVKAAFAVALEMLLSAAGCAPADVAVLCLAGALGEHVAADDLATLGFVPPALAPRIRAVGNSALEGACLLALHGELRAEPARLCARARVLSPVDAPDFHNAYLRHMRLGA